MTATAQPHEDAGQQNSGTAGAAGPWWAAAGASTASNPVSGQAAPPPPAGPAFPVGLGFGPEAEARRLLIDTCGAAAYGPGGKVLSDFDLHRKAMRKTHPDHRDGDRTAWDRVDAAARTLGLYKKPETARGRNPVSHTTWR